MGKRERLIYRRARRRVQDLMNFYRHLITYAILAVFFFLFNLITGNDWILYGLVFLGWALVLAIHALFVYILNTLFIGDWEERKIKEYMNKKFKPLDGE